VKAALAALHAKRLLKELDRSLQGARGRKRIPPRAQSEVDPDAGVPADNLDTAALALDLAAAIESYWMSLLEGWRLPD
jgi:hypothetical protein